MFYVDQIELAEVKVQWCAVVNMVKLFSLPTNGRTFLDQQSNYQLLSNYCSPCTYTCLGLHCFCCYYLFSDLINVLPEISVEMHLQIVT
jgi:hypothetical protein